MRSLSRTVRFSSLFFTLLVSLQARAEHNPLLPRPKQVQYGTARLALRGVSIRLSSEAMPEDRFTARELAASLSGIAGISIPVLEAPSSGPLVTLRRTGPVDPLPTPGEKPGPDSREAYSISVTSGGVEVQGRSSAAVYYGAQTLMQLVEGTGSEASLPEVEIHDWPSLPYRGVMVDTSHGGLPTEEEVKRQIDFLARWKNNQYYLYSEASIALNGYPIQSPDAQFSQAEIRYIVAYAHERHVDVIPCMELYGHLHDLFRVERYAGLSLIPHGREFDPRNPQVAAVMRDWVDQLTNLFPTQFFHIGFDETREAPIVLASEKGSPATLYMKQFRLVSALVRRDAKTVLVWSDMFCRYPTLIPEIPAGTIVVPWGYDRTVYEPYWKPFEHSSLTRFIATGVSIWDQVSPNFSLSFDNIDSFLAAGRQHGVLGLINTLWTDDIAVLVRPAFPGMAYGAVAAWQDGPVDRKTFFPDYARIMFGTTAASEVALGLAALDGAENELARAVGGKYEQTSPSFWDDPLTPAHLTRATAGHEHFRKTRLQAEDAEAHLSQAMRLGADPSTLSDSLLEARLLDYAGMKNIYAAEMASFWRELGPRPDRRRISLYIEDECISHDHSRVQDLMDASGDLQRAYRAAWLDSYTPYRLGTVMETWSAECQYWWKLSRRLRQFVAGFREGATLPPLESFGSGN